MKSRARKKAYFEVLSGKQIAVIGYGSQGRAQAQNLRDSGFVPIIGLPPKSRSRKQAGADNFRIVTTRQAIESADIIAILAPDHRHKALFDNLDQPALSGKAVIFAHGLSIAFGLVRPPDSCDVILVAPHGPGVRLRELYLAGKNFSAFWGIHNDASGNAAEIARAYAEAIGCSSRRLFPSTFREEAIGDIFGEQAVLCGGLVGLIERGFETLVKNGLSPENAYLECVNQLDLIIDLVKRHGPAGMFERISTTAAFGSLRAKDKIVGAAMRNRMQALYDGIENGSFAKKLIRESDNNLARLKRDIQKLRRGLLQKTHDRISRKLEH